MGQQVLVPLVSEGLSPVGQAAVNEQEQVGRGSPDRRVSGVRGRVGRVQSEAVGPQVNEPGIVSVGRAEADGLVGPRRLATSRAKEVVKGRLTRNSSIPSTAAGR